MTPAGPPRPRSRLLPGAVPLAGAALLLGTLVPAGPPAPALAPAAADPAAVCVPAVVSAMTLEQQVGQLFISGADATAPTATQGALVTQRHLGGVILTGRSSAGTAATRSVTDALRARSGGAVTGGVGLWVATDQEGGNVQVLRGPGFSTIPTALAQGGLPPATLRADAASWGGQLRAAGVDVDLAPVLDTVPADLGTRNQPIGFYAREYGTTPGAVSTSGRAFADGLRDAGVQATGKHFPGLGRVIANTDTTTGVTDDVTVRGDAYLQPFADAVTDGIPLVMVSSAIYSRIDPGTIATFSPTVVTQMLRGDLGFRGVIVSDSLGAAALAGTPAGRRAVDFIAAGGDVALSVQTDVVGPMVDGVLARARTDAAFAAQVAAAARTVVRAKFADGLVTCPDAAGAIQERWIQLGGAASFLGSPVGGLVTAGNGAEQDYQHGAIGWSPATGAHAVSGAISGTWAASGRGSGRGYPVADMFCGLTGGGCAQWFTDGAIYWSPATGAHGVSGAILESWVAHGYELGLGYPVGEMFCGLTGGGCGQWFTAGAAYWSPAGGAHTMSGAVLESWAAQGYETGPLGYPVAERVAVPTLWRQQFQGGVLTWDTTTGVVTRG